jgi:hypothetical protein
LSQHFSLTNEERSSRPAEAPRRASMPTLVVEDLSTMVRILRNLLQQIGLDDVDHASGARIALEMMRK